MSRRIAWRRMLGPSLSRRIGLALLATLMLVGLEILAWNYLEYRRDMAVDPGVREIVVNITAHLQRTPAMNRAVSLRVLIDDANQWRRAQPDRWKGELAVLWLAPDGQVLYESHPHWRAALLAQTPGRDDHMIEGRPHWAYRQDSAVGSVRVAEPVRGPEAMLRKVAHQLGFYLPIAFPVVLLPLWLALHRGLRPLRELVQRLSQRDAQDLGPLDVHLPQSELQPLGQAFDAMLGRLRLQRERERRFVQEAAHELRTPLAVIAAQAHVLRQAETEAEREQAARALEGAVTRAAHLSQQLLTLASVESVHTTSDRNTDLAEQTRAQLAELLPLAEARRISLALEAPDQLPSRISPTLWGSLLGNLVGNALRYCPEGSRIEVRLSEQAEGLCLQVADDGPGIAEADRQRVFERFWRSDQTGASGSGLGLAIVRQVVHSLGGTVAIGSGLDGRGVAFSVSGLAPQGD
ncbi:ATP-binding protein [Paucibacter sediminis]|uniref:histidine kinase n=1 Tax=Paucibacter sediminis TaxID=3019553 RepID=A0AA95NN30_9BURK|nr:ATP-binding protein [Paucibacter sp. S2-9]WIT12956.1 ATP-binding protein [Paucibacter sp. S2-9]